MKVAFSPTRKDTYSFVSAEVILYYYCLILHLNLKNFATFSWKTSVWVLLQIELNFSMTRSNLFVHLCKPVSLTRCIVDIDWWALIGTGSLKGIVSDSNNIFSWHESEDINKKKKKKKKKKVISKISVDSNFM